MKTGVSLRTRNYCHCICHVRSLHVGQFLRCLHARVSNPVMLMANCSYSFTASYFWCKLWAHEVVKIPSFENLFRIDLDFSIQNEYCPFKKSFHSHFDPFTFLALYRSVMKFFDEGASRTLFHSFHRSATHYHSRPIRIYDDSFPRPQQKFVSMKSNLWLPLPVGISVRSDTNQSVRECSALAFRASVSCVD